MGRNTLPSLQPAIDSLLEVRKQYQEQYLAKIKSIDDAIIALGGDIEAEEGQQKPKGKKRPKTFESALLKVLEDGRPRISPVFREDYNKNNSKKKFDAKNFSTRLSITCNKENPVIKYASVNGRNYFGKVGWFDGDKFKAKYLEAIESQIPENANAP